MTFVAEADPTVTLAPDKKPNPARKIWVPPAALPPPGAEDSTRRWENSEVLPSGDVAVAVTGEPGSMTTGSTALMVALPLPSVVTSFAPRYVRPSRASCGRPTHPRLA